MKVIEHHCEKSRFEVFSPDYEEIFACYTSAHSAVTPENFHFVRFDIKLLKFLQQQSTWINQYL